MINMIGKKYGMLTVLERTEDYICQPSGLHERQYICKCECGNIITAKGHYLRKGLTINCGCIPKIIDYNHPRKYNRYDLSGEYGIGYTSNTNRPFYFDLEDYDLIKERCWSETNNGYILTRYPRTKEILLHRYIMNNPEGMFIDHINHNKADNRKMNLRIVTSQENAMNRKMQSNNKSGFTGVHRHQNKWIATIGLNRVKIQLGSYDDIEDAFNARKEAEKKYFGDYSYKNSTGCETYESEEVM